MLKARIVNRTCYAEGTSFLSGLRYLHRQHKRIPARHRKEGQVAELNFMRGGSCVENKTFFLLICDCMSVNWVTQRLLR